MAFDDLNNYPDSHEFECDICIVGAGAAGITIAKSLTSTKKNVILLESGGLEYEQATQSLYKGLNIGKKYFELIHDRLRYFGGTTNHWGGWCAPYTKEDFYEHDWITTSGWPLNKKELDPYYEIAQKVCNILPYKYLDDDWPQKDDWGNPRPTTANKFNDKKITSRVWQHSTTKFSTAYEDLLKQAKNVKVLFHANALELVATENSASIQHIVLSTIERKKATIKAKQFVLACGGLENPRLLLLSDSVNKFGIGNEHDLVGRYFMEHLEGPTAKVIFNKNQNWFRRYSPRREINGTGVTSGLCTSYSARKRLKILHHSTTIDHQIDYDSGYLSLRRIMSEAMGGEVPNNLLDDVINTAGDIDEVFKWVYHRINNEHYFPPVKPKNSYTLFSRTETEPNYNSRMYLGDKLDHFGQRQIVLDWQTSELDKQTIFKSNMLLAEEVGRLKLGRVKLADWLYDGTNEIPIDGGHHHIGTTKMSNDATNGVVDANCKVHGIDNLYIAGSSVFPTGGYVNPTLTIVALAARLADYVSTRA